MTTVLIPVDGSDASAAAVSSVAMWARHEPLEIHLLSVQAPLSSYVTRFFSRRAIRDFHRDNGERQLASGRGLLEAAALPYTAHIEIGEIGPTIARRAAELGADEIVLGSDGTAIGDVLQWLRGAQVRRHAAMPVVVVMPPRPAHGTLLETFGAPYAH
jgi:nucleotide-binding universal stress UspA family protein